MANVVSSENKANACDKEMNANEVNTNEKLPRLLSITNSTKCTAGHRCSGTHPCRRDDLLRINEYKFGGIDAKNFFNPVGADGTDHGVRRGTAKNIMQGREMIFVTNFATPRLALAIAVPQC